MTAAENRVSRREFLRTGAAVSTGAVLLPSGNVFAGGSDKIRVAMVGCGSRGTKDAIDCLKSDPGAELVAMADLFRDRLDGSLADRAITETHFASGSHTGVMVPVLAMGPGSDRFGGIHENTYVGREMKRLIK